MPFWNRTERDKHLATARKYKRSSEYDRAGDYFQLAGADDEALAAYLKGGHHRQAAELYAKQGKRKEAADQYVQARDFRQAANLFAKAKDRRAIALYEKLGEHFKAAQLVEANRDYRKAGELFLGAGHAERAARCFALDRDFARAAFVLEEHLANAGGSETDAQRKQWLGCADLYIKASKAAKAGAIYERLNEHVKAAAAYKRGGDPSQAIAMYLRTGDAARAEEIRRSAPDGSIRPDVLAELLYALGDWGPAAELFRQAGDAGRAATCYDKAGNKVAAAEMYERSGDFETAAELLQGAAEYSRASKLYESCYRYDAAAYAAAMAVEWERAAGLYERAKMPLEAARSWLQLQLGERAIPLLQKIPQGHTAWAEASVLLARAFRAKGMASIAEEKLSGVIGDRPVEGSNMDAYYELARLREESGDDTEASSIYQRLVAVDFNYHDAAERLEALQKRAPAPAHAVAAAAPGLDETATLARDSGSSSANSGVFGARYDVVGKLADSVRGEVFKAWDTSLGRTVVLKRLVSLAETDQAAVQRYVHEAQQASKLHHSNIAAIYDAMEGPHGRVVAMEYVYGQSMREVLRVEEHLSPGRTIGIVVQMLQALEYAHELGVLHRNLRPENVLIAEKSHVKLTDFGMNRRYADLVKEPYGKDSPLHYVSPEQIRGDKLDARSDIYAVGCVVFEMLIGRAPFTGKDCIDKHLNEAPPIPSELDPSVPKSLDAVILKCLEKDPDERWTSAHQVLDGLRSFDFVPGQRIDDRYELVGGIGAGGMGKVFKARDLSIDEIIAMKVLRPEMGRDPTLEARFVRELKLARKIAHPSIVKVFDIRDWNDTKYITMEFIDGISLEEYIERSPEPDVEEIARFMVQLSVALHEAHRLGVIHRDIKPQNVLLSTDGTPKIVDFGIARLDQNEDLTSQRHIIGSPKYMSPEQIMGRSVDYRTDIYSLGVVMYYCLTRVEPFTAEDTNGIIMKQLRQNPTPPCQINPDLPPWMEMIVLRCLVKEPDGRYQSMLELADELRANL